jgi:hypothetical protein
MAPSWIALCIALLSVLPGVGCGEAADPLAKNEAELAGEGALSLSFLDSGSGEETPVRVEIQDAEGRSYSAPDALRVGGHCRDSHAPESPGAARSTLQVDVHNAWAGTTQFYSKGATRLVVPPGRYRVAAWKGFEYRVARREYVVPADQTVSATIPLVRWNDMPASGWFGSDGHLHIARARDDDARLARWMQAEDIHVANLLQWGTFRAFHNAKQYAFGDEGVYRSGPHHLLITGQENPRTHFLGHIVVLGAAAPTVSPSYLLTRGFFEQAHQLGGLAGYAHYAEAFGARNGLAVDLPHDVVDFVEVIQVGRARYETWYDALNAGARISPTAGSDYPCGEALPGAERFYTQVEGRLTRSSWLDGIRRGRTFATNGALLRFVVNGHPMGDIVELAEPGEVTIEGEVVFDDERDEIHRLFLIQNGSIVRTFPRSGDENRVAFRLQHLVEASSWLAIRAAGTKRDAVGRPGLRLALGLAEQETAGSLPSEAHSAPVFVEIGGVAMHETVLAEEARQRWVQQLDALAAELESDFVGALRLGEAAGQIPQSRIREQRNGLHNAIDAARSRYARPAPGR